MGIRSSRPRTRRENGRVVREYVGVGERGRRAAGEDEARRRQAEADREADRVLAEKIRSLRELADLLDRAALLAAGCHRANRGPWRRRRVKKNSTAPIPQAKAGTAPRSGGRFIPTRSVGTRGRGVRGVCGAWERGLL